MNLRQACSAEFSNLAFSLPSRRAFDYPLKKPRFAKFNLLHKQHLTGMRFADFNLTKSTI